MMSIVAAAGFRKLCKVLAHVARKPGYRIGERGLAYIRFATANPGLYTLMFGSSEALDLADAGMRKAGATRQRIPLAVRLRVIEAG